MNIIISPMLWLRRKRCYGKHLSANTVKKLKNKSQLCRRIFIRIKAESLLQSTLDMIAEILVLMSTEENADED